ncbi:beta-glucosidase [Fusarium torreyae]|uniref:beta-glucosidase n=1 Tax=Fusarium torreyae TaxID=1237075 RepID=A0A9W8RY15_9HYPO|nr:beta-glucosidase [Fusarium torreyae]
MASINVEKILAQLTDREKVSLLAGIDFWHTKPLRDHGVPSLRLSDGPNGVRGTRFFNSVPAACFLCGTALGATFDKDLIYQAGLLMAGEAKAKGAHVILGPTINMQRSPLGGRGFESYSEDPTFAGMLAAALINGIQEKGIAAAVKHFVCNDQEHERNRVNSIITERALRELYLLPFQIAIRDSKPKCIMTSYNKVNGTHVAEDNYLLNEVLRQEWGWEGLIMSDWFGTYSTSESLNAGLDLEMPGPSKWRGEAALLAHSTHKLGPDTLDDRVRAVLTLVKQCQASGVPENGAEETRDTPETASLLRKLAADSIVLLKNENNLLPLSKNERTLVIGPNARTAVYCGGGSAALRPYHAISPWDGICNKIGDEATFTIGAHSHRELPDMARILRPSRDADRNGVTFSAYNEPPASAERTALDVLEFETANMMFMDYNNPALNELWYADIEGYLVADQDGEFELGLCVYGSAQVFIDGELVIDVTENQRQGSAFLGCGTAEERCTRRLRKDQVYHVKLSFASAPTSKLKPQGVVFGGGAVKLGGIWKIDPHQEVAQAVELAKDFNQVVLFLGLNQDWEGEGFDRESMKLPSNLDQLAESLLQANPNTVIVMQSGTPVEMPWANQAQGLLHAWYGGNETGDAIADVVFGDVNPSGKLSLSFPIRNQDNPAYLNFRSEAGRVLYGEDVYMGYRWYDALEKPVAFPFGFGLSYTTFVMSNLSLSQTESVLSVEVTVKNTGDKDGAQVVQAYIAAHIPSINRPVKELKDFAKLFVKAGQSQQVKMSLPIKYACSFFDERKNQWLCQQGRYTLYVADSSSFQPGQVPSVEFEVGETFWWSGV